MMHSGTTAPGMRSRSLRGTLGTVNCDSDGNCYDDESGVYTPAPVDLGINLNPSTPSAGLNVQQSMTGNVAPDCVFGGTWPNCNPPTGANVAPTGASIAAQIAAATAATVAPIVKAATTQAPYYITNPATGQSVLYNPNTGTVAGAASTALSSLSPTTLLLGAVVLGGLLLMGGHR